MKIHLTLLALNDLQDLREYLESRSRSGLANVILDIESTIKNIQDDILYVLRVYHPSRKPLDYKDILKLE